MSVTLSIDNRFIYVKNASLKATRAIDRVCAYKVAGYFFSPAYKSRRWDGLEHLFKFTQKRGYHAPIGLAEDIVLELKRLGLEYEVEFKTSFKHDKKPIRWNPEATLRDYQKDAIRKTLIESQVPGRGVIKLPIRSGKTRIAAKIIQQIGRPTIFVVPSKWLLYQTQKVLRDCMPDLEVGQVGDSIYEPKFVTVATIQSLSQMAPIRKTKKRKGRKAHPDYYRLMNSFDLGLIDECHHFRGQGDWYRVFIDLEARFKIGFSATVFYDNTKEQEYGIIWLRGSCGPIRIDIPASQLIRDGYLLPQTVKMYRISEPMQSGSRYSATLKKRCITENKYRNRKIAKLASKQVPKKTIIIAREHAHIAAICEELDNLGVEYRTLTGRDRQAKRDEIVDDFLGGSFHVIVGNVLGEGVDIPDVECVINAEGGKDEKQTWQRQRNLTVVEGSNKVPVMIDFFDETSPYFLKHSRARLKVYKSEEEFSVELI